MEFEMNVNYTMIKLFEGCQFALHVVKDSGEGPAFCSLVLQDRFIPEFTSKEKDETDSKDGSTWSTGS